MATPAQLSQYCTDHGFVHSVTQGTHMSSFPSFTWTLVGWVVAGVIGYEVCRYGVSTIYTALRNDFIAKKVAATPVVTISAPATPVAVVTSTTV
jgi:hypothetical protein